MRRLIALLLIVLVGIVALNFWQPGGSAFAPAPTATSTPLPDNFTLIPTLVPDFPCELQNVDRHDDQLCRSESVHESIVAQGEGVLFIAHDYQMGQGCWDGVTLQSRELRVCNRSSGVITTLSKNFASDLPLSPDGEWLAFGTMNPLSTERDALRPHLFRVRRDGSGLQQLDVHSFAGYRVSAPRDLRWLDNDWLAFSLWDGTSENGWHPYRLRADGSGVYIPLPDPKTPEATDAA